MIDLRHVRAVLAIALHEHFTRAAAALGLAQPALSQQIAQLEDDLGVRLFERSRRGARLTEAGRAFRARAERIVAELDGAYADARELAGLVRGRVVLGTIASLAGLKLPTILTRFRERHPGIDIVLREDHSAPLVASLGAGGVDLALTHAGSLRARRGRRSRPPAPAGLSSMVLSEEELVLAVPRRHRLAGARTVAFAELAAEPFVLYKEGSMLRELTLAGAAAAGFTVRSTLEASGNDTVRAFVAAGFGVSLLPRSLAAAAGPPIAAVAVTAPRVVRVVGLAQARRPAAGRRRALRVPRREPA
jgi:LysR family transcriptional activator of glutamate synthase operon